MESNIPKDVQDRLDTQARIIWMLSDSNRQHPFVDQELYKNILQHHIDRYYEIFNMNDPRTITTNPQNREWAVNIQPLKTMTWESDSERWKFEHWNTAYPI